MKKSLLILMILPMIGLSQADKTKFGVPVILSYEDLLEVYPNEDCVFLDVDNKVLFEGKDYETLKKEDKLDLTYGDDSKVSYYNCICMQDGDNPDYVIVNFYVYDDGISFHNLQFKKANKENNYINSIFRAAGIHFIR